MDKIVEPSEAQIPRHEPRTKSGVEMFGLKALFATTAGSILSLVIALTQTWYSERLEALERQGREGIELQAELFQLTGNIENELIRISTAIKRNRPAGGSQLARVANESLETLYEEWRNRRLLLRNRAAQIYGRTVGELVYSVDEQVFSVDRCNLVVRAPEPGGSGHCEPRQDDEIRFLTALREEVKSRPERSPLTAGGRSPASFGASLWVTRRLVTRYNACVSAAPSPTQDPCGRLGQIIILRIDLTSAAREQLANEIMVESALSR